MACRRDDRVVHHGHPVRHPVRDPAEIHQVQGRTCPLRHGAAQLPFSLGAQCLPADLGESPRLFAEGLHHYLCGNGADLVPADL